MLTQRLIAALGVAFVLVLVLPAAADVGLSVDSKTTPAGRESLEVILELSGEQDTISASFESLTGAFNQTSPTVADENGLFESSDPEDTRFLFPLFNPGGTPATVFRLGAGAVESESTLSFSVGTLGGTIGSGAPQSLPLARLVFDNGTPTSEILELLVTEPGGVIAVDYTIPLSQTVREDCNQEDVLQGGDFSCIRDLAERDLLLRLNNTLAGDLDGNGEVNFPDFLVLARNFGSSEIDGYISGDIDLSGTVDFADFLTFSRNFGASSAAMAVPEIASWSGLVVLGLGFLLRRRRRCGY